VPRPVTVGSVHPAHHVADLLARDATEEPGELREVALDEGTACARGGRCDVTKA
jgi:hypothetical protein